MELKESLLLARSDLWSDRVRTGRELSAYAGQAIADAALRALLLDAGDTAVVAGTAEALLTRGDVSAWKLFAAAWALAAPSQADHLSGALSGALFEASLVPEKGEGLKRAVTALLDNPEDAVRDGAKRLLPRVLEALPE